MNGTVAPRSRPHAPLAYENVVLPHVGFLHGVALRLTRGQREDAEDLVQDTLARAYDRFHTFRLPEEATVTGGRAVSACGRAWLHTILRRIFLTQNTRRRRAVPVAQAPVLDEGGGAQDWLEQMPDASPEAAPEDTVLRRASVDALWEAVRALPQEYRAPLLLVSCEGLGYEEAASRLGIPPGTLRSRIFRARRLLRRHAAEWQEPDTTAAVLDA